MRAMPLVAAVVVSACGAVPLEAEALSALKVGGSGQYATVQDALNAAKSPHEYTVQVAQGTYVENITINSPTKVRLQGGWSADFTSRTDNASLTVIDGGKRGSVFSIGVSQGVRIGLDIDAITIRNGLGNDGGGIAVTASDNTTQVALRLTNSIIDGNVSKNNGGGIFVQSLQDAHVEATFTGDIIANNAATYTGGGVTVRSNAGGSTVANFTKNVIRRNVVRGLTEAEGGLGVSWGGGWDGGGVGIFASKAGKTTVSLVNNLITENKAGYGGGVFGYAHVVDGLIDATLTNNVIAKNETSGGGGGIFSCSGKTDADGQAGGSVTWNLTNNTITQNKAGRSAGGILLASGSTFGDGGDIALNMRNDIVWGNTDLSGGTRKTPQIAIGVEPGRLGTATANIAYSDVGDIVKAGSGAYTVDRVMNTDPQFADAARGDYLLRDGSPGIDAGDPSPAYDDGRRPLAKGTERNDLGAYGGPKNFDWPSPPN